MQYYFKRFTFLTLTLFILTSFSFSQNVNFPTPREEKLLNGLKVLIWKQAKTGKVSINLRIHSGSAFDPQNKEGTFALFGDILFPDPALKTFFEEDLDGKLEVISTYDYVQINAEAKADEFLTAMQTIATAISRTQIDKETLEKVKKQRLEYISNLAKDSRYISDQTVSKNLFGNFPYGRSQTGTFESLNNVDFAELIITKQKFITADNATLAISGDVQPSYAYKAARRLFGVWQKSLNKIPANFRLPEPPEKKPEPIYMTGEKVIYANFAAEGLARNDADFYAMRVVETILNNRLNKLVGQNDQISASVLHEGFLLRGVLKLEYINRAENQDSFQNGDARSLFAKMLTDKITEQEFKDAKSKILSEFADRNLADIYFDVDTYKLKSVSDEIKAVNNVNLKQAQKVADELKKETVVEAIVVSKPAETKTEIKQPVDPKDPNK